MIWFFVGRWSRGRCGETGCLGRVFAALVLVAIVMVLWKWFLIVGLPILALVVIAAVVEHRQRRGRQRPTPQARWSSRR